MPYCWAKVRKNTPPAANKPCAGPRSGGSPAGFARLRGAPCGGAPFAGRRPAGLPPDLRVLRKFPAKILLPTLTNPPPLRYNNRDNKKRFEAEEYPFPPTPREQPSGAKAAAENGESRRRAVPPNFFKRQRRSPLRKMSACRFGTKPGGTAPRNASCCFPFCGKISGLFYFPRLPPPGCFFTANHRPYHPKRKKEDPHGKTTGKGL